MQVQQEKTGTLRSWNEGRGYGFIRVGPLEKYFLHVSQIRSGTETPVAGMTVHFDVSPTPRAPGRDPQAIDAHIDMTSTPASTDKGGAK